MKYLTENKYILALIFVSQLTFEVTPASPAHIHTLHKERVEDGAFVPRDHNHLSEEGEHHSEFDHEAILGSVKEAQEYDHLSPEESKRRLRILLTKMDLNKDQLIDRNELRAWILRSFKMLTEEESADRFEDADEDQDGRVSWAEYKEDTYGSEDELEGDVETMLKQDRAMFQAADADKDGLLDRSEFVSFSHPEESPDMLPHILRNTLDDKDSNGDGFIDFQEFVGEKGKGRDREWLVSEKDKFDNDLDKDKDGRLNPNEILSWVVPSNDEIAQEEVQHLFASADDDHDNVLSFDEILENHEIFVGSEVTDYGEHLHNIEDFKDEL